MPLGLDYEDLAVGAQQAQKIQDSTIVTKMKELELAKAVEAYSLQNYQNKFTREQAPVKFAADQADLYKKIAPYDEERARQMAGQSGKKAAEGAVSAVQQFSLPRGAKITLPTGEIKEWDGVQLIDPVAIGKAKDEMETGVSHGSGLKGPLNQLNNKIPPAAPAAPVAPKKGRKPNEVGADELLLPMAPPETQVARDPQAEIDAQTPGPQAGYGLGTEDILREAGGLNRREAYPSEDTMKVAEKRMSLDSQLLMNAAKTYGGMGRAELEAATKSQLADAEHNMREREMLYKQRETELKAQVDVLQAQLAGAKQPPPARPRSGTTKDPVEEEWKRIDSNLDAFNKTLSKYNKYGNYQSFLNLGPAELRKAKYPENKRRLYETYKDLFDKAGVSPDGRKGIVPPKGKTGASLEDPAESADRDVASQGQSFRQQLDAKTKALRSFEERLQLYKVVPSSMFDRAKQKLVEQGLHPDDIEALREKYVEKIR